MQGFCIQENLRQTQLFGVNVVDAAVANDICSMKDYLVLATAGPSENIKILNVKNRLEFIF